jgi:hypothetical protein
MTRLVLVSDTHTHTPELPSGDILLHAGDLTNTGSFKETTHALGWLAEQAKRFSFVVFCAGNHDWFLYHLSRERSVSAVKHFVSSFAPNIFYLEDELVPLPISSRTMFADIVTIYGSPAQPTFCNWAFNYDRGPKIKAVWDNIPSRNPFLGIDILMTHGPAHRMLDWVGKDRVGCEDLRDALDRVQPKVHLFGHTHAAWGKSVITYADSAIRTQCYNAALVGEDYQLTPKHKPWVLDYDGKNFTEVYDEAARIS